MLVEICEKDKDDGSHTKDLQKVKRFVERARSLERLEPTNP